MLAELRELYEGDSDRAQAFRYGLVVFDIVSVLLVIGASFAEHLRFLDVIGMLFGIVILADLAARLAISPRKFRFWVYPTTLADLIAGISFLITIVVDGLGFLRVLRTLRLLHTYQLVRRLRRDFRFFRRYEDEIAAAVNLAVFLFVMTGLVYATQHRVNSEIGNYADALYFTVTALTTTGFGDITLPGTGGRLIAVVIMIFGVTLFLRLAQILFRPSKVHHRCPTCGLLRHEHDAVHCKHCGTTLNIDTEGDT
ncbi:MAG: potassium channel family protein [Tranquillimonas sp.]|jgi:voltage-gated potassium channel